MSHLGNLQKEGCKLLQTRTDNEELYDYSKVHQNGINMKWQENQDVLTNDKNCRKRCEIKDQPEFHL